MAGGCRESVEAETALGPCLCQTGPGAVPGMFVVGAGLSEQRLAAAEIDRLKREAKRMRRAGGHTHIEALDELARARGYRDWSDLAMKNRAAMGRDC